MNVFFLDFSPEISAKYHNDIHVRKMLIESTQMLSTCSRVLGYEQGYKEYQPNHPDNRWLRQSQSNWIYLYLLAEELSKQFEYRFDKVHKTTYVLKSLRLPNYEDKGLTLPPCCMPDYCKLSSVIDSYRYYYVHEKSHLYGWTKVGKPIWFDEIKNNTYDFNKQYF